MTILKSPVRTLPVYSSIYTWFEWNSIYELQNGAINVPGNDLMEILTGILKSKTEAGVAAAFYFYCPTTLENYLRLLQKVF